MRLPKHCWRVDIHLWTLEGRILGRWDRQYFRTRRSAKRFMEEYRPAALKATLTRECS